MGRGGAARYYLTTVDRELFLNILVIGLDDSWEKERGYDYFNPKNPVNFINQTSGMLESMNRPEPPFSKERVDRLTFAAQTRRVIDRLPTKVVDGEVVDVDVSENEMRVPKSIPPPAACSPTS